MTAVWRFAGIGQKAGVRSQWMGIPKRTFIDCGSIQIVDLIRTHFRYIYPWLQGIVVAI
jgi:hypothetical protein